MLKTLQKAVGLRGLQENDSRKHNCRSFGNFPSLDLKF